MRLSSGHATLAAALPAKSAAVRGFAAGVAGQLAAGPLTFDHRRRLFARAGVLGIGRFEANLIIAIAERQASDGSTAQAFIQVPTLAVMQPDEMPLPRRWAIATIAAVQLVILSAAWWVAG